MRHIRRLKPWSLQDVLEEKYRLSRREVGHMVVCVGADAARVWHVEVSVGHTRAVVLVCAFVCMCVRVRACERETERQRERACVCTRAPALACLLAWRCGVDV